MSEPSGEDRRLSHSLGAVPVAWGAGHGQNRSEQVCWADSQGRDPVVSVATGVSAGGTEVWLGQGRAVLSASPRTRASVWAASCPNCHPGSSKQPPEHFPGIAETRTPRVQTPPVAPLLFYLRGPRAPVVLCPLPARHPHHPALSPAERPPPTRLPSGRALPLPHPQPEVASLGTPATLALGSQLSSRWRLWPFLPLPAAETPSSPQSPARLPVPFRL